MSGIYKASCPCGKHDFVFPQKPWTDTEVKCPECGKLWKIKGDPPNKEVPAEAQPLEPKAVKETTSSNSKKDGDK